MDPTCGVIPCEHVQRPQSREGSQLDTLNGLSFDRSVPFPRYPSACFMDSWIKCYGGKIKAMHETNLNFSHWLNWQLLRDPLARNSDPGPLIKRLKHGRAASYLMVGSLHWSPIMQLLKYLSVPNKYPCIGKTIHEFECNTQHCIWWRNSLLSANQ